MEMRMDTLNRPGSSPVPQIILLTTSDYQSERREDLARLIESVARVVGDGIRIKHYLLLQRCDDGQVLPQWPDYMHVMRIDRMVSLSAARNIMLRQVHADGVLDEATLVTFPDDDAWYPDGILQAVLSLFQRRSDLGLLICRYASQPLSITSLPEGIDSARRPGARQLITNVSSITQFVRASHVQQVAFFDERLGIGAPVNGGEDLDFALRVYAQANRQALWIDAPLVGHPDKIKGKRSRYFTGSFYAIVRGSHDPQIAVQAVRKAMVGVYLVLSGEFKPGDFAKAVRYGLQARSQPRPQVSEQ
jgi:hypothetical protein